MKKLSFVISMLILFAGCSKPDEPTINRVYCDNLVTDTTGTNDNGKLYMPNAFSPNGDGLNDISRPLTQNIAAIVFSVYDESNTVVFTSSVLGQGWQPTGSTNTSEKYYYRIQATTVAGHRIGQCGFLYKLTCRPGNITAPLFFEDQLGPAGPTGSPSAESLPACP